MAVTETGVSYYGLSYVERVPRDFQEMLDHNCNVVIFALSELEVDFWFPNIVRVAETAKEMGLRVYLDTWGVGKWFGGEPPSLFLTNNVANRQHLGSTNEAMPAACFNTEAFRRYYCAMVEKRATHVAVADDCFWDVSQRSMERFCPPSTPSKCGRTRSGLRCRFTMLMISYA